MMISNNDIIYDSVKKEILKWLEDNKCRFEERKINIEVIKKSDSYSAVFDFNNCMAQLDINKADFSPYRFVCFEVQAIKNEECRRIYSYYDDNDSKVNEILSALDEGIKYARDY